MKEADVTKPATERFASLRHRRFQLYFAGQWITQTGTWLQNIAQVILVLRLAHTGVAVGVVSASQTAPVLLLGLWAGAVVDRANKLRLLVALQAVQMTVALGLAIVTLTGHVSIPVIYACALLSGLCGAFDNPARRSLLIDLVPPRDLANATSLHSAALTAARIAGPLLAGLIVAHHDVGVCFVINAMSFAVMLMVLLVLATRVHARRPNVTRTRGLVRDGLRQVWHSTELRAVFTVLLAVGTLSLNWQVLLPLLMRRSLHGTDRDYTWLLAMYSVGSVAGTLRAAGRPASNAREVARYAALYGVSSIALAAAPTRAVAMLLAVPNGLFSLAMLSFVMTAIQRSSSAEILGRVMALFYVALVGSSALGAPLMGWVADVTSARAANAIGGVAALTVGLAVINALRGPPRR